MTKQLNGCFLRKSIIYLCAKVIMQYRLLYLVTSNKLNSPAYPLPAPVLSILQNRLFYKSSKPVIKGY